MTRQQLPDTNISPFLIGSDMYVCHIPFLPYPLPPSLDPSHPSSLPPSLPFCRVWCNFRHNYVCAGSRCYMPRVPYTARSHEHAEPLGTHTHTYIHTYITHTHTRLAGSGGWYTFRAYQSLWESGTECGMRAVPSVTISLNCSQSSPKGLLCL